VIIGSKLIQLMKEDKTLSTLSKFIRAARIALD
jgi:tryptophan synthase alpha subunit